MTEQHECEHKWEPEFMPNQYIDDTMTESVDYYARCLNAGCDARMTEDQMRVVLNEHSKLKRATEALTAEQARDISNRNLTVSEHEDLQAYADALAG